MGLILPGGPSWAHWTHNFGAPSTTAYATAYAPGVNGGTPADASSATLLSALSHDCEYLVLGFVGFGEANQVTSTLLDLLIDTAGGTSWTELIADLVVGMIGPAFNSSFSQAPLGFPLLYHFPIWLPAGTSIGVRAKTVYASAFTNSPRIFAMAAGGNRNPGSWWCGQKVETVGTFDQNTCRGQAHTPGASGSFSSWTSLGSTLAAAGGAVQYGVQGAGATLSSSFLQTFEFGIGSTIIGPPVYKFQGSLEGGMHPFPGPIFYDFPAGAQLQVRAASSSGSPVATDVAAYVVQ